jgi:hypothetical protein
VQVVDVGFVLGLGWLLSVFADGDSGGRAVGLFLEGRFSGSFPEELLSLVDEFQSGFVVLEGEWAIERFLGGE